MAYIGAHVREPIQTAMVASALRCNPDYLGRVFREAHGFTLTAAIHHRRLRRARELLMDSQLGVAEIAGECGFADAAYFGRMFRRYEGMPPLAYRRLYGSFPRQHQLAARYRGCDAAGASDCASCLANPGCEVQETRLQDDAEPVLGVAPEGVVGAVQQGQGQAAPQVQHARAIGIDGAGHDLSHRGVAIRPVVLVPYLHLDALAQAPLHGVRSVPHRIRVVPP